MDFQDSFDIKNTLLSDKPRTICWNKRPCYRLKSCKHCQKRYTKFMQDQALILGQEFGWVTLTTFNFIGKRYNAIDAIVFLIEIRKNFNDRLRKKSKYLSVIGLGKKRNLPHFHILLNEIDKTELRKILPKNLKCSIHQTKVKDPYEIHIQRAIGYLLDQNFYLVQQYRPYKQVLITSSRGFRTGKPYTLGHLMCGAYGF